MSSFKLIILLILYIPSYSQIKNVVGIIEYTEQINLGLPIVRTSELIFRNNSFCYIEKENKTELNKMPGNIQIKKFGNESDHKTKYFVDLQNKTLFQEDSLDNELLLVKETLTNIEWIISNDASSIFLGYKCKKAKASFRGRIYTAWFAPEIPVEIGPWKLHGLPGLILKAEDNFNQVIFTATKLAFLEANNNENNKCNPPLDKAKILSLKTYIKLVEKNDKEYFYQIISNLPRDTNIKTIDYKKDRKSEMEISFEWEKNE